MQHFGEVPASTISEADCQAYIKRRRDQGRKDGTIWTELGHLARPCAMLEKNLIDKAPKIYHLNGLRRATSE